MKIKPCVIGLGYVGLPALIKISRNFNAFGFDTNFQRIQSLKKFHDFNLEYSKKELSYIKTNNLKNNILEVKECNFFIVCVPTPIKLNKKPDLAPLKLACKYLGKILKKNDIIVFESTVYPGATEEFCLPIIKRKTKLKLNKDFFLGYSPERLSPGDFEHGLKKTIKITSGSNSKAANMVDTLYKSIVQKGTFKVDSIKIAEATKLIENIQRDINIAYMNELVFTFSKLKIPMKNVLEAAGTKWNFVNYKPGLVGGSCIPVNPYYLKYKSEISGYRNRLVKPAREINDEMSKFVAIQLLNKLKKNKNKLKSQSVLILGFAYKENATDTYDTQVFKIYNYLKKNKLNKIEIYDPVVDIDQVKNNFGIKIIEKLNKKYDGIILAVPHTILLNDFEKHKNKITKKSTIIIDVKHVLKKNEQIFPL